MSIWLAEHDLPGFATWMRKQSGDETAARAAHHRSPRRARSEGGAAGDRGAADDVEIRRSAVRARAEERAGSHRVDQRALRDGGEGEGSSGRGDAAVVRHRADGRRGRGARGARPHPARRQHRRRPADDRSGARGRIGARHAGVADRRRAEPTAADFAPGPHTAGECSSDSAEMGTMPTAR